jgi:hypothetical protein
MSLFLNEKRTGNFVELSKPVLAEVIQIYLFGFQIIKKPGF